MNGYKRNQQLTNEDLKKKNDAIKIQLKKEFGMKEFGTSTKSSGNGLPGFTDEMENEWLNHILDFERQVKDQKMIKVYERIGRPDFKRYEDVRKEDVEDELDRLFDSIENANLRLDFLCEYDDETIYRFITEEFFEEEIQDIRIPGMTSNFIYEEYHTNHEYDIKEMMESILYSFFLKKIDPDFHKHSFTDPLEFEGKILNREEFLKLIVTFKKTVKPRKIELLDFNQITFDLDKRNGKVEGKFIYEVIEDITSYYAVEFSADIVMSDIGFWEVSKLKLPIPIPEVDK